jgi:hypothetical protein
LWEGKSNDIDCYKNIIKITDKNDSIAYYLIDKNKNLRFISFKHHYIDAEALANHAGAIFKGSDANDYFYLSNDSGKFDEYKQESINNALSLYCINQNSGEKSWFIPKIMLI